MDNEEQLILKRVRELKGARVVFCQTLLLNLLVAAGKLGWGVYSNTLSMVADGFHSMLDSLSNLIGIIGLTISLKPPDAGHPYGHRKFEAMAAIAISFMMFFACFHVLTDVIERLSDAASGAPSVSMVSYIVILISIAVNIIVTLYERKKSEQLQSALLEADSAHTLSDVFVSCGVLVALVAAQFHLYFMDIIASLLIVMAIFKAGYEIVRVHIGTLVDAAVLDPDDIERIVLEVPGVISCHKIRTRGMRDHVFLDLHVQVAAELTVREGHEISYQVEDKLKSHSYGINDVVVHIEEEDHAQ